ncbi:MAG: 30S ribosomal protein S5, partial [Nanoarchaeota archaeon]|nr:30S ribosomal protein S5 [Nanoarchaeota archaeon]
RAWRQTQKKTKEGNVLSFSAMAVAGDRKGHIGVGFGRARETLPSREKAVRNAKLNITKIKLGFESPLTESENSQPHTIPFKIEGKCGSVKLTFWPAPRGTGLVTGDECKKILKLAGIKDIYGKAEGNTKTTFNLQKACVSALEKTTEMRE